MNTYPKAKKSLGQHFLHNKEICDRIVRLLHAQDGDNVIEIGPGPGALTVPLSQIPLNRLVLLEKDSYWARKRQELALPHMQAVMIDALTFNWNRLCLPQKWKIIGNLPYNVASPLMWDIFSQCSALTRAVFMVQKEVGERITADCDCKAYGALTVWIKSFTKPRMEFSVGPGAFSPPPKVDSAVISFDIINESERPRDLHKLARLLKLCFQNRRKQINSIFRQHGLEYLNDFLPDCGVKNTARPENIPVNAFQYLASQLKN